jgi:hypothetical protein
VYPWDQQSRAQQPKYSLNPLKIYTKSNFLKQKTIFYTRYVDDIVIIYDTKRTHPDFINTDINKIHTDIKLNPTYENNGCASFLDLLVIRKPSNLEINTFRTPTTTDTAINFLSKNNPIEHKVSAVRHHITRMQSLTLTPKRKQKKKRTLIRLIAQNNNFPQKLLQKLNFQIQHKQTNQDQINERSKNKTWTTFTCYSPIIRKINNLFKHTCVGISLNNTSIVQQLTKKNSQQHTRTRQKWNL